MTWQNREREGLDWRRWELPYLKGKRSAWLAQSMEHDSRSRACKLEPHIECRDYSKKSLFFFFLKWKDKITCCVLPLRNARHTVLSALHIFMKIHWIFIKTLQANYREVEYLAQGYTGRTSGPDSPGCCICVLEHGRVWLTVASLFKNKFLYFRQQYILCRTLSFFHLPCSCPDIL